MNRAYRWLRRTKNSSPALRRLHATLLRFAGMMRSGTSSDDYEGKLRTEIANYADVVEVHDLPPIYHYWSRKHLLPILQEFGVDGPGTYFAKHLLAGAQACGDAEPLFASIGAGNCDLEVALAGMLRAQGLTRFCIECIEINPHMLERGRQQAERGQVSEHIRPVQADFNHWRPERSYAGIIANQSLHHVMNLEGLFDAVRDGLAPQARFVISDMIGRNGHQRWPEALEVLQRFWKELPKAYRYNHQLDRNERRYENWDCSLEGFEGIRAQDIVPLLLERFHFEEFIAFGNVIDVFIDRGFGPHFDAAQAWDQDFIDRVHAYDEQALQAGTLTPTHMLAALSLHDQGRSARSRGLDPSRCVRAEGKQRRR